MEKITQNLKKEDFTYSANAEGYMIKYKGQSIGGASIMGKFKGRGKAVSKQIKDHAESAQYEISRIMNGSIAPHMKSAIENIDNPNL